MTEEEFAGHITEALIGMCYRLEEVSEVGYYFRDNSSGAKSFLRATITMGEYKFLLDLKTEAPGRHEVFVHHPSFAAMAMAIGCLFATQAKIHCTGELIDAGRPA